VAPRKRVLGVQSTKQGDLDLIYWQRSGNLKVVERINKLIESAMENPGSGIGKPERLKFYEVETYSRRIDRTHRLVYQVRGDTLIVISARFHYVES
jgi:toxin YoeB